MDVLPYTAFDVLAMVMDGTHLPARPPATTASEAAPAVSAPAPDETDAPDLRRAA